jgi:superfamily II DNA helicase RecQ
MKRTIIYMNNKPHIKRLRRYLRRRLQPLGLGDCVHYHHASTTSVHRSIAEDRFKKGTIRWIIATDSLGMGADIRDIARVIQVRAGETASAFLQRIGRAGRDGISPVEGILLFEKGLLAAGQKATGDTGKGNEQSYNPLYRGGKVSLRSFGDIVRNLPSLPSPCCSEEQGIHQ